MRSKLSYLIKVSLNRKIKTKWFLIANIILLIAIVGLINIDNIINFFGGNFSEVKTIHVTNRSFELFKTNMDNNILNEYDNYKIEKTDKSYEEIKENLTENDICLWFQDDVNTIKVTMLTYEYIDTISMQSFKLAINNTKVSLAMLDSNISPEDLEEIYSEVNIDRDFVLEDAKLEDENTDDVMVAMFTIIILPIFMLIIILIQMIGVEINDEKTTRGMEIIISNVSATTHLTSKVIASNLFVIIQGVLLLAYSGIGLLLRTFISDNKIGEEIKNIVVQAVGSVDANFTSKLLYLLPIILLLLILTFIAYSLLAGILASMTTNMEDFQQLQTPMMITCLVGYYLAMMASLFEGSIFLKIMSTVPLVSAILAPSLFILGEIGIIEIVIALVLLIGFIFILIKYGLKIYVVGILNYSSKDLWKKMFKALKSKS